jgi:exonuclease VII large subunit
LETKLLHQTTNAQERFGKYTKQAQDTALSQFEKKINDYMEDLTTQGYNHFQNWSDDVASNLYSNVQRTLNDMTASAKESWDETIQKAKTSLQEILPENTKPPAQSAVADSSKQDRVPRFPIHRRNVLLSSPKLQMHFFLFPLYLIKERKETICCLLFCSAIRRASPVRHPQTLFS